MGDPVTKRIHLVRVWRLNANGGQVWPEKDFETENPDEIGSLRSQAEAEVKRLKNRMPNQNFSVEVSEDDVTFRTMTINLFGEE